MKKTLVALLSVLFSVGGCTDSTGGSGSDGTISEEGVVSSIAASTETGSAPLTVTLEATSNASSATYLWDFGDGTATESGVRVTHTFESAGVYSVVLYVQREDGEGDTSSVTIRVSEGALTCPESSSPVQVGRLSDSRINECSGIAWSHTQPIIWLHNDSGDSARFYGVTVDGDLVAVVRLSGASARDWEDMARGPWPGGGDALFFADIGDNGRSRSKIRVYRVPEPDVDLDSAPVDITVDDYDVIDLVYPDHPHDAETLLVDPDTGDIYIVSKEADGNSGVYFAGVPADGDTVELVRVASVKFGTGDLAGSPRATGGDVSADGRRIIIRTYNRAFIFNRPAGGSLADAFSETPCRMSVASEPQGEAIAFAPQGIDFYTISEGTNRPIYLTECTTE